MYHSLYCKFWKGLLRVYCERELATEQKTALYWPPLLWPSALCLSRSPGLLNRRLRGPALYLIMAFFTSSYHQLVWSPNSIGGPEGLFSRVWLSLPHLVSDVTDPQLNQGPREPPRLVWLSLPHLVSNSVRSLTHQGPQGPPPPGFLYHILSATSLDPTVWFLVLTKLYNSSTQTQSPTQSLEWHV